MRSPRRHGDAVERQPGGYCCARFDEDSEGFGRRRSRRHRQFRNGADDPAETEGNSRAALLRDRRLRAPGLCRDRTYSGHDIIQPSRRSAAALSRGARHRLQNRDRALRPAPAERHPSRYQALQHPVSSLGRCGTDRLRPVASQPVAGFVAGRISRALRHRALYGAGAAARRPRRPAQRSVFARRAVVFFHDRRAAFWRKRNDGRDAAAAVARSLSAASIETGLSALVAGNRAALPRDRSGVALSDRVATGVRTGASRPDQADGTRRAAQARSALAPSGVAASTAIQLSRGATPQLPPSLRQVRSSRSPST